MNKSIGIDIGYGYTKIYTSEGAKVFPSVVGNHEDTIVQLEGFNPSIVDMIDVEGQKYLVGESALKHSDRFFNVREKNWIDSITYRVLLSHVLKTINFNGFGVSLVTGLPVSFYKSDKDKLANLIRSLALTYGAGLRVKVIPQPMGSFFDFLFDIDGHITDEKLTREDTKIGVLDIGFYTSDLITIHNLEVVEKQIASWENGLSTAYTKIAKDIETKYELTKEVHDIEKAVRSGYIKTFGEKHDISNIVNSRMRELANEIEARVRTIWKSGADIDIIIVSGGGASALRNYLKLYKNVYFLDKDGQISNARGFWKYARRLS